MADDDAGLDAALKETDRAAWLSFLFADAAHRPALHALHAFAREVASIPDKVSEALPGEVRLQWWRELLEGEARGEPAGNPVAAALLAAIARYRLPRAALGGIVDARTRDLYDEPFATTVDLELFCGETHSALIRLDTIVLADGGDTGPSDAAGHAGVALGITALLADLARRTSKGRAVVPLEIMERHGASAPTTADGHLDEAFGAALAELRRLARHHLAAAERLLDAVPVAVKPAYLPLALVAPMLSRMDRRDYDPFRDPVAIGPLRTQWLIWRMARRG
jgi:phytoene synthase